MKKTKRFSLGLLFLLSAFAIWSQTYTFDIDKAARHLTKHARKTSAHCCAWYTMRALQAGGCPAIILPAQWYRYFMPLVQFEEVSKEDYHPQTGDVVVFERPTWRKWNKISHWWGTLPCLMENNGSAISHRRT